MSKIVLFSRDKKGQIVKFKGKRTMQSEKKIRIAARMLWDNLSHSELNQVIDLYNDIDKFEKEKKEEARRKQATGFEIKYDEV